MPCIAYAQEDFHRYFNAAVQLYNKGESERALEQIQRARQRARELRQDVSAALYEGLILMDLGQREQALVAFETGLLLDPEAKLPALTPPKVSEAFEQVRQRLEKKPLAVQAPPVQPKLEPPAAPAAQPYEPRPSAAGRPRTLVAVAPWVLGGVSVAAAGTGTVFGLQSRSKSAELRTATERGLPQQSQLPGLLALRDDARGRARVANVMFGTAALTAGGALLTWLLSSKFLGQEPEAER